MDNYSMEKQGDGSYIVYVTKRYGVNKKIYSWEKNKRAARAVIDKQYRDWLKRGENLNG
jgi:hypothetical protein